MIGGSVSIAYDITSATVTSWSPIATTAVFGRQRTPARTARGSAFCIVSASSSSGECSGVTTVTSSPALGEVVADADRLDVADRVEDHDVLAERVGVEQRPLVVDHPRLLGAGDRHRVRLRRRVDRRAAAGRDDHRVGCEREHRVDVGVDTEANVDAAARALVGAPVGERGHLRPPGQHRGEPDLAAELRRIVRAA